MYQIYFNSTPVGKPMTLENAHNWWCILRLKWEGIDLVKAN